MNSLNTKYPDCSDCACKKICMYVNTPVDMKDAIYEALGEELEFVDNNNVFDVKLDLTIACNCYMEDF